MTTTTEPETAEPAAAVTPVPMLDVVVPVYNEEADLATCVRRLRDHLTTAMPYPARVTIADNASTDATLDIARRLAAESDDTCPVRVVHLDEKGRGRALNQVWRSSDAQIVAYCDVDLSTDLNALMPLIAPLVSGYSDIAIGTRLSRSAQVTRGPKREFISRSYNLILKVAMRAHFSDAQCGFKAMRTDVARELLPHVEDTGWFFDTELLVLAERIGLRIAEVPVDWVDDPDSSVDVVGTAIADLRGCARVGWALAGGQLPIDQLRRNLGRERDNGPELAGVPAGMTGQVLRFISVGVASTLAYVLLYLLLHTYVGAQVANFLSLAITAVLNTAANRRFTFGVRGRAGLVGHHLFGWGVFIVGWLVTASSLAALHVAAPGSSKGAELAVLIIANLVATATRFVGLRWVFVRRDTTVTATAQESAS
ncbi:MAG: glycosyltransferase [Gordonia sp. (in: high G+C Gram-positive bacteria)]|uniref:glycosyltransferase n=1 Tax=Gordonia sp. (in: high G+C Gram-positive bacteria) TaxID=84139 RepID=UPI003BB68B64